MDGTIRVETSDLTFDISRGADGKVYLTIEGVGAFAEDILSESEACELGMALMGAAKESI